MSSLLRLLALVGLLLLSGCYTTQPDYSGAAVSKKAVVYYVRAHDTLFSIGKKFGLSYRLIAKRNHIRQPYKIYVGQRLYIDRNAPMIKSLPISTKTRRPSVKKKVYKQPSRKQVEKRVKKKYSPSKAKAVHGKGKLLWPVKGRLSSKFGRRGSRMHDGIDIAAPVGTPIYAVANGEVVYSDSRMTGYGKMIIVRHGKDLFTVYAHNQRNLVKKGKRVKAGDVIARLGETGRTTGPNLHFEVRRGRVPVDPLAYLPRR